MAAIETERAELEACQSSDEDAWKCYHGDILAESMVLSENELPVQRKQLSDEVLRKGFNYNFFGR